MARYALVPGAAGDIGRAICAAMAADGWGLFISDHPAQERRLKVTSEACEPSAVEIVMAVFDVTDADAVAASVDMLAARHGASTAVVANAGIQGDFAPVHEHDAGVARRVLEVNVVASAARSMVAGGTGGSIVATASMAGVDGAPNMPANAVSKAAVIGLVKAAGLDLARHVIRVNAVSPGFIGTGSPVEVADVVCYLAGERSSYVTGVNIKVAGGAL